MVYRLDRVNVELAGGYCIDQFLFEHKVFDVCVGYQHPLFASDPPGVVQISKNPSTFWVTPPIG